MISNVALVSNSAAGKNQLRLLMSGLEQAGIPGADLLGVNQKPDEVDFSGLAAADAVVISMAPSKEAAQVEIEALTIALEQGKKAFLYADTFGSADRPWFAEYRMKVNGIFVPNQYEADRVKDYFKAVYPVGNPEWFRDRIPSKSRGEACQTLGIDEGDLIVLFGGTKQELADFDALATCTNALLSLSAELERPWTLVYTIHPGTPVFGDGRRDEEMMREAITRLLRLPAMNRTPGSVLVTPKGITTELAQCAANLVVECMSQTGVIAALRNQPLVTFFSEIFLMHYEYLGGSVNEYPLTMLGATEEHTSGMSPYDLADTMKKLLDPTTWLRGEQLRAQKNNFSAETDPVDAMLKVLLAA